MRGLLKFILLTFFFCLSLNAFDINSVPAGKFDSSRFEKFPPDGSFTSVQVQRLSSTYVKIDNDIYLLDPLDPLIYNTSMGDDSGWFRSKTLLVFHDSSFEKKKIFCSYDGDRPIGCFVNNPDPNSNSYRAVDFSYYERYQSTKVATCQPDEHFNTDTKKCERCYLGYSWDPAQNRCYKDCSDPNWNKWGLKDGSCIDCSKEETLAKAWICACKHRLSTPTDPAAYDGAVSGLPLPNGLYSLGCANGESFQVRDPKGEGYNPPKPNPDPKDPDWTGDNNKTDPKPNPNPGGNNGGGNSGGGNNGGSQDNQNPGPGNGEADEKFCKEHPKDPKCKPKPKPDNNNTTPGGGGGGGGNNDNKDTEAKFNKGDFDDGDLEKERNSLYNGIAKHINDNLSKFDGIRDGVDQFVSNVQLKGFEKVQASIKGKCPIKKQISLPGGKSQDITVDYCENLAPVSEISYYAFYVGFAVGGLILFLKLLIFSI